MDGFDIAILAALQVDGRLTNNELAERVPLSASQCARRRARLEETGYIRAYRVALDPQRLGLAIAAFVQVTMSAHSTENAAKFRNLVEETPEILEAFTLTGEADYLLRVATTDLKALARLVNEVLLPHPAVARVQSQIVLDDLKDPAGYPLGHLHPG